MVAIRGAGWGLASCLVDLIAECDQIAPNRSTVSDGSIGDAAHSARSSDHNPDDGWVCAVDVTDDKANGCDADLLARHIVASRDPRVKYVIWNGTIAKSYADAAGHKAWTPYPYTGTNPHDKHTHVSVHNTTAARNDLSPWWPQLAPPEDDMPLTPAEIETVAARCSAVLRRDILNEIRAVAKATDTRVVVIGQKLDATTDVDEAAIAAGVLAGLTPGDIAAAIPDAVAEKVADELAARLSG